MSPLHGRFAASLGASFVSLAVSAVPSRANLNPACGQTLKIDGQSFTLSSAGNNSCGIVGANPIDILGSPSGLAHGNGNGIYIQVVRTVDSGHRYLASRSSGPVAGRSTKTQAWLCHRSCSRTALGCVGSGKSAADFRIFWPLLAGTPVWFDTLDVAGTIRRTA